MILEEDKVRMEAWCNRCGRPFRDDAWLTEEDESNRIFDVSEKAETNEEQIRDRVEGKSCVDIYVRENLNDLLDFWLELIFC